MTISWFCVWQSEGGAAARIDTRDFDRLLALVRGCPGLVRGHVMTPAHAHDPYYVDEIGGSPCLIVQLEFPDVSSLEGCLRRDGHLACLEDPAFLPSLAAAKPAHQAMLGRAYPVADPKVASEDGSSLSYWVEYAGPAKDENAWHNFYINHHPPLLAQFPGIRQIEIYTPATIVTGLAMPVRPSMQRNKTVFDSAEAMNLAMQSPVRDALRRDFGKFPPFEGAALHFPFKTVSTDGGPR